MKRILIAAVVIVGLLSGVAWADVANTGSSGTGLTFDSSNNTIIPTSTGATIETVSIDASGNTWWFDKNGRPVRKFDITTGLLSNLVGKNGSTVDPTSTDPEKGAFYVMQASTVSISGVAGQIRGGIDPSGNFTTDISGNKIYSRMIVPVITSQTITNEMLRSYRTIIDVSPTLAVDTSLNLEPMTPVSNYCQELGGLINIWKDASGNLIGLRTGDTSSNICIIDASGNMEYPGKCYKNVYLNDFDNETMIGLRTKNIDGVHCVWTARKMAGRKSATYIDLLGSD